MTEVWMTPAEWVSESLTGLPGERALQMRATREGWDRRKRSGRGGGWEYPLSALPKPAQEAYARRQLAVSKPRQDVAVPDTHRAADLKDYQRTIMIARSVILAEIDRMVLEGMAQNRAIDALIQASRDGTLSPDLANAVANANARRGQSGRTLTRATIYNWIKARKQGDVALAPTGVPPSVVPAWAPVFMRLYAKPQKPDIHSCLRLMTKALPTGVTPPSYHQVRRFLRKLDAITRNRGRMGPKALQSMMAYVSRTVGDLWPGAIACGDGHTWKALVAHPIHGRPFRPEITTIIDVYCRKILGWSVALAENTLSVADALRYACETTTVPDIFYYDNGSGANNKQMDDEAAGLMARLGITKTNSIPGNSQARGVIEKLHSHLWHRVAKRSVTYVGKDMDHEAAFKVHRRLTKDFKDFGESKILPTWQEFIAEVTAAVEDYNNRPHSTLDKVVDPISGTKKHLTPNQVWQQAIDDGWTPDTLTPDQTADLFRPHVIRKANRCLVSIFSNEYFLPDLEPYHGQDVMVCYDIHVGEAVLVKDMEGRLIGRAVFGGNKRSFVPVTAAEHAMRKRVAEKTKRLKVHESIALEELSPAALLEHKQSNIIDLTAEQIAVGEAKMAEILAASAPVVPIATTTAAGRPRFGDDMTWIQWLLDHPDEVTDSDRRAVYSALTPSLRMRLEMAGVSAPAISTLLSLEAKAV